MPLKLNPTRKYTIINVLVISSLIALSFALTEFFPNDQKCVNGLCVPSTHQDKSSIEQFTSLITNPLTTAPWPERWSCGDWSSYNGWIYITSDITTFLSYFGIPLFLIFFLFRRKVDFPFKDLLLLYSFFILFCGITHLIDAIIFWVPTYGLLTIAKVLTAGVSFTTLIASIAYSKSLMTLKGPEKLQKEVDEKTTELKNALEFNQKLFLELHHRIKNNLQNISSILQMKFANQNVDQNVLRETIERIADMGKIHEILLRNRVVNQIDLDDYIRDLVNTLSFQRHFKCEFDVSENIIVSSEASLNIGFIVAELFYNTTKYAFPKRNESNLFKIEVRRKNEQEIEMVISDNGQGYDTKGEFRSDSLGNVLIDSFVSNLNGERKVQSDSKGTYNTITFPDKWS